MVKPPKRPETPPSSTRELPYLPGDPIPTPEAVEKNTETTWALFKELSAKDDMRYSNTVPVTVPGSIQPLPGPAVRPRQSASKPILDKLLAESTQRNRVCPTPQLWQELYDLLVAKAPEGTANTVPRPMTGAAWSQTSSLAKRMSFKDQIGWAASHQLGEEVQRFIARLAETQWHHMGE